MRKIQTMFSIAPGDLQTVKQRALDEGISMAELIRRALDDYLAKPLPVEDAA